LLDNAVEYDYVADDGHKNIGSWIDQAGQAGRPLTFVDWPLRRAENFAATLGKASLVT
jgi:hypothetical protein